MHDEANQEPKTTDFSREMLAAMPEKMRAVVMRRMEGTVEEVDEETQFERECEAIESFEKHCARLRARYRAECRLDGDMFGCTFDAFEIRDDAQKLPLKRAQRFAELLPRVTPNLMLFGPTGCGKSHLARAITICVTGRREPVNSIYVNFAEHNPLDDNDKAFLAKLMGAEHVTLDDIDKVLCRDASDPAYRAVAAILEHADSRGRPKLTGTSERCLETLRDDKGKPVVDEEGAIVRPGHDLVIKPYLVGRMKKLFHWQAINGPNGRDPEYWTCEDPSRYWIT